ncbi:hypothetical protein J8J27_24525, partial [Mycobacterium tuberculosis]|nr:hypothetical protein [Mycobacterium tuberculosis]
MATAWKSGSFRAFFALVYGPAVLMQIGCLLLVVLASLVGEALVIAVYGGAFVGGRELLTWAAISAGPVYAAAIVSCGLYAMQRKGAFFWIQTLGVVVGAGADRVDR